MQRSISHSASGRADRIGSEQDREGEAGQGRGLVCRLCQLRAQGGGVLASSGALVAIWAAKITMGIHCTSHFAAFERVCGVLVVDLARFKAVQPLRAGKCFPHPHPDRAWVPSRYLPIPDMAHPPHRIFEGGGV